MINAIVNYALNNRLMTIVFAIAVIVAGVFSFQKLLLKDHVESQ